MRAQLLCKCLVCLALLFEVQLSWTQESNSADLVKLIKQGSAEAMLEAGNKGATDLMPLLRSHLNDSDGPNAKGGPGHWLPRQAAQLALAKLGDQLEQRKIGCELFYGNLAEQSTAFYKLEYVGGWFEINKLTHFLADTEENSGRMMPQPGIADGDATVGTRQYLAVRALDRMSMPKPAGAASKEHPILDAPKRAREWRQYIDIHKQELEKLSPTGEGVVEYDDYCESYVASLRDRPDSYLVVKDDGTIRTVRVEQRGFGALQGFATFNGSNVPVRDWSDSKVTVELPSHVTGQLIIVKSDLKVVPVKIR